MRGTVATFSINRILHPIRLRVAQARRRRPGGRRISSAEILRKASARFRSFCVRYFLEFGDVRKCAMVIGVVQAIADHPDIWNLKTQVINRHD